ncbi:uncharacterized protein LOC127739139 [Mytilus californianus]|uniref:uncharacterized protein LOC127739139 n=1 Tax=Mytilus californianus TaxID=6549 RepID=UPI00224778D5|nr:uncharacterized protein LOC127739139 [Mytilus californianus]
MKDKNERESESSSDMSKTQNIYPKNVDIEDIIYERVDDKDAINVRTKSSTMETDSTGRVLAVESDQPNIFDTNPQTSDETASKELSAIFKSAVVLKDDEDYTLTLWDFAGDEEFYATHQTFLNPDAVYLVVANLNDKDQDKHVTFKFWMETIHCYGCRADTQEVGPNTQDTPLNPPVIFVGTHTDELQNQNECSTQITSHMDKLCKDTRLHLRTCHQISNKNDGNDKFQKIREDIFALATNSKTAEKEYPVKFIQLERVLHAEYTSEKHVRILSFNRVKELASKISIPITEEDELNLFLRYQNEIGNLLYFNDIPEYIILDPQWLADAFRCIVTATKFQEKLPCFIEWKEVKETGKIKSNLMQAIFNLQQASIKDHQSHLIAVMEKFDIIINPVVQTNRDPTDKDVFFYIPCMMQVNKIEEVDKLFEVEDEYKSMCLCFIFNFLPPYLISHLIVSCLRKYTVAFAQQQEGLFKDCCVFDVSECGCTKLLLVKCGSMIELQIWQWDKEIPCQYEEIFCFIKGEIDRIINTRNRMTTVSFEIKWKCSLTSYTCEYGFKDFGKVEDGKEFHCGEHKRKHKYKDDWFGETSKPRASLSHNQPHSGLELTTSEQQESTTIPEINTGTQVKTRTPNCCMPISSPLTQPEEHFPPPPSSNYPPGYSGCSLTVLANYGNRLPDISSIVGRPSSYRQIPINALQQPNENPWNKLFLRVSKEVIPHWKNVGRYLEIGENNINIIDENHHDVQEKAYSMLLTWQECKGHDATKEVLIKALHDCELQRVAEIVQKYCETEDGTDPETKKIILNE